MRQDLQLLMEIDGRDTGKIKQLLNEEYLLKNDDDNDEKCNVELDYKNIKKEQFMGTMKKLLINWRKKIDRILVQ